MIRSTSASDGEAGSLYKPSIIGSILERRLRSTHQHVVHNVGDLEVEGEGVGAGADSGEMWSIFASALHGFFLRSTLIFLACYDHAKVLLLTNEHLCYYIHLLSSYSRAWPLPEDSGTPIEWSFVLAQASDVEINVDDTLVTLHINPYFLRLNFSASLHEDESSSARYDPSLGYLTVTLTKTTTGQEFQDLDLLAKLLAPRPSHPSQTGPTIEVLRSEDTEQQSDILSAGVEALSLDQERQEILEGKYIVQFLGLSYLFSVHSRRQ
jgi:hypothetical protein